MLNAFFVWNSTKLYNTEKSYDKMLHVAQSDNVKKEVINGEHDFSCLVEANGCFIIDWSYRATALAGWREGRGGWLCGHGLQTWQGLYWTKHSNSTTNSITSTSSVLLPNTFSFVHVGVK